MTEHKNKILNQWVGNIKATEQFKPNNRYCKICSRLMIAYDPRYPDMCNRCVADKELQLRRS